MGSYLSAEQIQQFEQDGFLVVADFVGIDDCARLRARALELVAAWEPTDRRTVFTTDEQTRNADAEFMASGDKIWCFFEEGAVAPDGSLLVAKERSVNKLGHAMHDLDPVFEAFTYRPELAAVAADLGLPDALALQSMYIFKPPGLGGEVGCHQDATFLYTDPLSVIGFWFAIEDATIENGCMWAAPGGHRTSLRKEFRRNGAATDDHAGARFEVLDPTPLPDPAELVPIEVGAGTLVVLHGLLPHWSAANTSPLSRHAYAVHCISAAAAYPEWNWLQRSSGLPLRRLAEAVAA